MGRLVAEAKSLGRGELRAMYESQFMLALSKTATQAKNTNVLQHILGFFKRELDNVSRQELLSHTTVLVDATPDRHGQHLWSRNPRYGKQRCSL